MTARAGPRRITRRSFLISGATLAAVGAGGFVWSSDPHSAVIDLVKRLLPGVSFDAPSMERFADDFLTQRIGADPGFAASAKWSLLAAANRVAGLGSLASSMDDPGRSALSKLLQESNFFYVDDPRTSTIVYSRRKQGTPCSRTPWADLSLPANA